MTAEELWGEEEFLRLVSNVIPTAQDTNDEPINLAAERNNTPITWQEFAGDFL